MDPFVPWFQLWTCLFKSHCEPSYLMTLDGWTRGMMRSSVSALSMAIGDRHYTLGAAASDSCTMQLNGVITGADKWTQFSKVVTKKGREKVFVLSASDHDLIMAKDTLS